VLAGLVVLDVAPAMNSEDTGSVSTFVTTNPTFADPEEVDAFLGQSLPFGAAAGDGMAAHLQWGDDGRLVLKYDIAQFAGIKLAPSDELRAIVGRIVCPTRVLRGERSKVIDVDAAAELAGLIPGATWARLPNAGHTIQTSKPVGVATEIVEILDAVRQQGHVS
jgi:esterase